MIRYLMLVGLLLAATVSNAQLYPQARASRPVTNPAMVLNDRGATLEVIADKRMTATATAGPQKTLRRQIFQAKPTAPISVNELGVVFNHSMQTQGYTTGEIAFKLKGESWGDAASVRNLPGFKSIVDDKVFVVVARNPVEFVDFLKDLQQRSAIEWVEPIVFY